jgi:hypothetical protein
MELSKLFVEFVVSRYPTLTLQVRIACIKCNLPMLFNNVLSTTNFIHNAVNNGKIVISIVKK